MPANLFLLFILGSLLNWVSSIFLSARSINSLLVLSAYSLEQGTFEAMETQLNFAVFCASSACGVSSERLNYKKHSMVRPLYRFHTIMFLMTLEGTGTISCLKPTSIWIGRII